MTADQVIRVRFVAQPDRAGTVRWLKEVLEKARQAKALGIIYMSTVEKVGKK